MQLRRSLAIPREAPVNAFDIAKMVGADVRFLDTPSLEGMLVRDPGLRVLLPSTKHRRVGRILFSCAHEIGHHQLGHGTRVDEYLDGESARHPYTDEELLANSFAGHLLMPRPAVLDAFDRRGWVPSAVTAPQAFVIAGELGVGYRTLVTHMNVVMGVLPATARHQLEKIQLKHVKAELCGTDCTVPLLIADSVWRSDSIDAERGSLVMLPNGTGHACPLLSHLGECEQMSLYSASGVGTSEVRLPRDVLLRISRLHYVGPLSNRYLPDPDEH